MSLIKRYADDLYGEDKFIELLEKEMENENEPQL